MNIGILLGDDIGHEVVPECVKVMKAAAARTGLAIDWHPLPIGKHGHEQREAALHDPRLQHASTLEPVGIRSAWLITRAGPESGEHIVAVR